jgi:DNA/RNA endonuclease G (NUC1)
MGKLLLIKFYSIHLRRYKKTLQTYTKKLYDPKKCVTKMQAAQINHSPQDGLPNDILHKVIFNDCLDAQYRIN